MLPRAVEGYVQRRLGCKKDRVRALLAAGAIRVLRGGPRDEVDVDRDTDNAINTAAAAAAAGGCRVVVRDRDTLIFPGDAVYIDGTSEPLSAHPPPPQVFALHKPSGMACDLGVTAPPSASRRHRDLAAWFAKLAPNLRHVGRLDKPTTGLLLASTSSPLPSLVLEPGRLVKTYRARVRCTSPSMPTPTQLAHLTGGDLVLNDGPARAVFVDVVERRTTTFRPRKRRKRANAESPSPTNTRGPCGDGAAAAATAIASDDADDAVSTAFQRHEAVLTVRVDTGRNRIVRRMLAEAGLPVLHLHRSAIGSLTLESLLGPDAQPGDSVRLSPAQLATLWDECGGRDALRARQLAALRARVASTTRHNNNNEEERARLARWLHQQEKRVVLKERKKVKKEEPQRSST